MADYQNIQLSFHEDIAAVRLIPGRRGFELDKPFDELLDFVTTNRPTKVVLDFSRIEHFSPSPAWPGWSGTLKHLRDRGGQLKVCRMHRDAADILCWTIGQGFQIYASEEEAFQAFKDDE